MTDAAATHDRPGFDPDALGRYGRHLTLGPPGEHRGVPAEELLDGPALEEVLARHRGGLGEIPAEVAAAHWAKHHVTLLVPGILAAWTLHRVGLDASPANLVVHLDGGTPRRFQVRDPTRLSRGDPDRDRALRTLFGDHLAPLSHRLRDRTGLARDRLWSTAGNVAAWLFDQLADHHPDAGIARDRAALLEASEVPWTRDGNPLEGTVRYEDPDDPGLPDRIPVRRSCCLKRAVPGKEPCRSCPAVGEDRRHDLVRRSQGT